MLPYGNIISVERDAADITSLYITLNSDFDLLPLGREYLVCISSITNTRGVPLSNDGDCIGSSQAAKDLSGLFVYPNPIRTSDEKMIFAGLTSDAEITIYTLSQRVITRIRATEKMGGAEWNLRDDNGKLLTSGTYLYSVTGKDESGKEVSRGQAKFVYIRDK